MASKPKKASRASTGKNQGGRPELDPEAKRDTLVRVLTTASEYQELKDAAAYVGSSVSNWLRLLGLERARVVAAEKEAARARNKQ